MSKHKIAIGLARQATDTARLAKGTIATDEYKARTVQNSGTTSGSIGGAAVGATIGSALAPGVGTTVGAVVGGVIGSAAGTTAGRKIGRWLFLGDDTPDPEVLAILDDPTAFDPASHRPRFHPIPPNAFSIDHHQTGTYLLTFDQDGARYLLILQFDRFSVEATLAKQGGQRARHATGTVHFNRVSIPFHIGRPLIFELTHAHRMLTVRAAQGPDEPRAIPFDLFKYV